MTIKKRLFISNILMIVIPVIVSVATVTASFYILNFLSDGVIIELLKARQESQAIQEADSNIRIVIILLSVFISLITVIFITSRILALFVVKKIEKPLEMLSDGVYQISEGNLDYKIVYYENDEFMPVCEAFNNMAIQLKSSVEEIQKNEQNRKELLASISHDIRSPLTSIKAFVEGLLDGVANTPESQNEYLQIIKQKTDDINNMVSQLFFYSKMDMGNYPTHPEVINVSDEIQDFVFASYEEYKSKGLLIEIVSTPTKKHIFADPLQLRSVIANILDNSAKYKNINTARALTRCMEENKVIRIIIEDDGPGVPENELARLFDIFYRGDSSRSDAHYGSGLGLAIASKALERMNGRIYAENIDTGGLRMIVEIPETKEVNRSEKSSNN